MVADVIRAYWPIVLFILLVPYVAMYVTLPWNIHKDRTLQLQIELEQLNSKYRHSEDEKQLLSDELAKLRNGSHLVPGIQFCSNNSNHNETSIELPEIYDFQPHLFNNTKTPHPAFIHSKRRSGVSIVLGIPTAKRRSQNYFLQTLSSLLEQMNSTEATDTLIVVFIAEVKAP